MNKQPNDNNNLETAEEGPIFSFIMSAFSKFTNLKQGS